MTSFWRQLLGRQKKTATQFPIGTKVYLKDEYKDIESQKRHYLEGVMRWFGQPTVYIITGYEDTFGYKFKMEGQQSRPFKPDLSCTIRMDSWGGVYPWSDRDFTRADPDASNDLPPPPPTLNPVRVRRDDSGVV